MAALAIMAVGLAISVKGMMDQRKAAKKAASAQRESNKQRTAQATIDNRARRAKLLRQAQMARATAENIQATQGGGNTTTSMATGALFTANTQQAVNLSNFAEQGRVGGKLGFAQLQYGNAVSAGKTAAATTKLGMSIMSNSQRIAGAYNDAKGFLSNMGGGGGNLTPQSYDNDAGYSLPYQYQTSE